jgi:hypothetical protein
VAGRRDAVGGVVEGVAGRVHGRGEQRQDGGLFFAFSLPPEPANTRIQLKQPSKSAVFKKVAD